MADGEALLRRSPAKQNDRVHVDCLWRQLFPQLRAEDKPCLLLCKSGGCEEAKLTREVWAEPRAEQQGASRTVAKWVPPEMTALIVLQNAVRLSPQWKAKTADEQRSEAVRLATTYPCAGFARIDKATGRWYLTRSQSAIRSALDGLSVPRHKHIALEQLLFANGAPAAFLELHPFLTPVPPPLASFL